MMRERSPARRRVTMTKEGKAAAERRLELLRLDDPAFTLYAMSDALARALVEGR
jgi:hypothetical protein